MSYKNNVELLKFWIILPSSSTNSSPTVANLWNENFLFNSQYIMWPYLNAYCIVIELTGKNYNHALLPAALFADGFTRSLLNVVKFTSEFIYGRKISSLE